MLTAKGVSGKYLCFPRTLLSWFSTSHKQVCVPGRSCHEATDPCGSLNTTTARQSPALPHGRREQLATQQAVSLLQIKGPNLNLYLRYDKWVSALQAGWRSWWKGRQRVSRKDSSPFGERWRQRITKPKGIVEWGWLIPMGQNLPQILRPLTSLPNESEKQRTIGPNNSLARSSLCPHLGVDIANQVKREEATLHSRESYLVKQTGRGALLPSPGMVSLAHSIVAGNRPQGRG